MSGWSFKLVERCKLSDMHHVFLTSSEWEQEAQDVRPGDLIAPNDRDLTITETSKNRATTWEATPADRLFLPVSARLQARNTEVRQRNGQGEYYHIPPPKTDMSRSTLKMTQ